MSENTGRRIHPLAIVGAFLFAVFLLAITYYIFRRNAQQPTVPDSNQVYNLTVFPAPTQTPTVFLPTELPTPTPIAPDIIPGDTIGVGSFVKVVGTSGLGLNIRASAGRGQPVNFLALDAEMFEVIGGPEVIDDLIWWQLEAPLDPNRSGWAAEEYLERIVHESPTP